MACETKRIELLTDKNYHVWALKIKALVRAKKLFQDDREVNTEIEQQTDTGAEREQETPKETEVRQKERKEKPQEVRRSERIRNKKEQTSIVRHEEMIPKNYKEATQSEEAEEWMKAMAEEIECMKERKVWRLVPREEDMKSMLKASGYII